LPTGLGELANAVLPRMVHGVVAIGKGYGTLTEVAHAIKLGRPVVSLGSWEIRPPGGDQTDEAIHVVESPQQAVDWLLAQLEHRARHGAARRHEIAGIVQETQLRARTG
jgi:predicted Rossmann-fold nucleotide-binding protein